MTGMKNVRVIAAALTATMALGVTLLIAATSQASQRLPILTLALTKTTVKVGGDEVSGAVTIATTVKGEAMDNPSLILLKPGVTPTKLGEVVSKLGEESDLDVIDRYATIVFDGQDASKGQTTYTEAVLPAGHYVATNDGNGFTPFTIAAASKPASLSNPKETLSTIEFGFTGNTTLHDGDLVRFKNDGYLIHMVQAAEVKDVADAKKVEADLLADNVNAAKKYAISPLETWSGPLSSGEQQQYTFNASPGIYVVFCSMNTQDRREHFQIGMYKTVTVVK